MTESNLKKRIYDVNSVTSSLLRHQKCHQNDVTIFFQFRPPVKISGYASDLIE